MLVPTPEGKVLKAMREEHKLSMRNAGELIGISSSTIAHIENGRMNPPTKDKLEKFLKVYGGIKEKSFYERVRRFKDKQTPQSELIEVISHLPTTKVELLLSLAKNL